MIIFNSYVKLPEGIRAKHQWTNGISLPDIVDIAEFGNTKWWKIGIGPIKVMDTGDLSPVNYIKHHCAERPQPRKNQGLMGSVYYELGM